MTNYFRVAIRHVRTLDNGKPKRVTETYLVDAIAWTEAEAIGNKIAEQITNGNFSIHGCSPYKVTEVVGGDDDYFYLVKLIHEVEEDNGKVKSVKENYVFNAKSMDDLLEKVNKFTSTWVTDVRIADMRETDILEYYPEGSFKDAGELVAS